MNVEQTLKKTRNFMLGEKCNQGNIKSADRSRNLKYCIQGLLQVYREILQKESQTHS